MKQDKILVLIPTKDRLDDFIIFADSWVNTTEGKSDVWVGIDEGDTTYDSVKDKYPFKYVNITPKPFLEILNEMAIEGAKEYNYVAFLEDDCNFVTEKWESRFIDKLKDLGEYGIVWGNDLLNKEYIVGLPFMNSKIIEVLGYMCPPEIKYLWADHFWKFIGKKMNSLFYFDDIIVEHRHYSTGKREKDALSVVVDSKGQEDFHGYKAYLNNSATRDITKLQNAKS